MKYKYLYRALRPLEIEKEFSLIPKVYEKFKNSAIFPLRFPIDFGSSEKLVVDNHQRFDGEWKTRGVSTSPHMYIAKRYAEKHKVIVKITTDKFSSLGIKHHVVKDYLDPRYILKPEDDEIILVFNKDEPFPKEIIAEVVKIQS